MHEADLALARLRADADEQAEWRRATAHLTRPTAPRRTRSRAQAPQRGKTPTGRSAAPTRRAARPYVVPPSAVAEWKRMISDHANQRRPKQQIVFAGGRVHQGMTPEAQRDIRTWNRQMRGLIDQTRPQIMGQMMRGGIW